MKTTRLAAIAALVLAIAPAGCKKKEQGPEPQPQPAADAKAAPTAAADAAPAAAEPKRVADVGFQTPESVLPTDDVYYVSNINGSPTDADGNGFISKMSPEGEVVMLKWIDGEAEGVTLNAPKGSTITGGTFYVADIDHVRMFDLATGKPKGDVAIKGATFLNDMTHDDAGNVYVSDTGIKFTDKGAQPTGTAAIYSIDAKGKVTKLASGDELGGPNGLAWSGGTLYAVTFNANKLLAIAKGGKPEVKAELPKGGLDGLVVVSPDQVLISSWEAQAVFAGPVAGPFKEAITGVPAPADIGYDAKRKKVLVPLFQDNAVAIYPAP